MGKVRVPEGLLPPRLKLSPGQEQELSDLADRLVAETMHANSLFLTNGRSLPRDQWKLVKTREQVQVYRSRRARRGEDEGAGPQRPRLLSNNAVIERRVGRNTRSNLSATGASTSTRRTSSIDTNSFSVCEDEAGGLLLQSKPARVPLIVASGVLKGTVEDVAFGSLANSEYAWRQRTAYVNESMNDGRRLLATMQRPTADDPFRFLGIKWCTRDYGTFIKRRDFLVLESTGIALDWDGERVFYDLVHSIELAQCPSPESLQLDMIRCNQSICYLSRQLDQAQIEVYCRGFSDAGGGVPEAVGASIVASGIADIANVVECSNLKKLAWKMQLDRFSHSTGGHSTSSGRAPRSSLEVAADEGQADCGVCGKGLHKKLKSLLHTGSACRICRQVCCC
jgi:hypothetical protein